MNKLLPWKEWKTIDGKFPYQVNLRKGDKELLYFGSDHLNDSTNIMFTQIEEAFLTLKPQLVLIEGVQQLRYNHPEKERAGLLAWIATQSKDQIIRSWGEAGFSAWLAVKHNVPVLCPEPDQREEIEHLQSEGFTEENIFLYYLVRDIDQYHRLPPGRDFKEYFDTYVQFFRSHSNWPGFDYSLANLQSIAEEVWPGEVDFLDVKFVREKVWPTRWETVVNEIARQCGDFRDNNILKEIQYRLSQCDRLFVVYGGSHLVRQEEALRQFFQNLNC